MKKFIFLACLMTFGLFHTAYGQTDESDRDLILTDDEKIIIFAGFTIAVVVIILFLARDILLRKKTSYDNEDLESKKDKTYEKYHSEWGDEYEEFGRPQSQKDHELHKAISENTLPNYYDVIGISKDATFDEIKTKYREQVKKIHPDKTKQDSQKPMTELIKAYDVLSDKNSRAKYDKYLFGN